MQPTLQFCLSDARYCLALGFGSGLSPRAPGTAGSVVALLLWFFLGSMPLISQWVFIAVALAIGVYICDVTARALGVHDHGAIVWDEFVGMWLALAIVPTGWVWWIAAFLAFRVLDIFKPWPIRWFDQKVAGGWGVMLDDVLAGAVAGLLLLALSVAAPA